MDLLYHRLLLLGDLVRMRVLVDLKERVEVIRGVKELGHQKVEQRPELCQIVLQWSASQQQSEFSAEFSQNLREDALLVLYALGLVQDQELVIETQEFMLLTHHSFVCRQQNIEIASSKILYYSFAFFLGSIKCEETRRREPLFDLLAPLAERHLWHHDDVVRTSVMNLLA